MTESERMIETLSKNLAPIRPVSASWPPALASWLTGCLIASIGLIAWLKPRPDIPFLLAQREFLVQLSSLAGGALIAVLVVYQLAVPGRSELRRQRLFALGLPAALAIQLALRFLGIAVFSHAPVEIRLSEASCSEAILALALLPGLLLCLFMRRYATTSPGWTGGLIGASSVLIASAALSFHCPNDQPLHLLIWHLVLPMMISMGLGFGAGRRWLRW